MKIEILIPAQKENPLKEYKKKMASSLLDSKVTRHCNSVLKQKIDDT